MESKCAEERKEEEGKTMQSTAEWHSNLKLDEIMTKRTDGSVIHNLYPFYQRKIAHGLDEFVAEHVGVFEPDEEEHKLVYTDLFDQYSDLFEGFLREFVEEQGLDDAEFQAELSAVASGANKKSSFLVRMVAAQTDYDFFCNLMKDKAREARKNGGDSKADKK